MRSERQLRFIKAVLCEVEQYCERSRGKSSEVRKKQVQILKRMLEGNGKIEDIWKSIHDLVTSIKAGIVVSGVSLTPWVRSALARAVLRVMDKPEFRLVRLLRSEIEDLEAASTKPSRAIAPTADNGTYTQGYVNTLMREIRELKEERDNFKDQYYELVADVMLIKSEMQALKKRLPRGSATPGYVQ